LGGRSHPKLNIIGRPIAKKYRDGKVKRTLKRRLKVLENVKSETDISSKVRQSSPACSGAWVCVFRIFIGSDA